MVVHICVPSLTPIDYPRAWCVCLGTTHAWGAYRACPLVIYSHAVNQHIHPLLTSLMC